MNGSTGQPGSARGEPPVVLVVTVTEGVAMQPEAAFLCASLRRAGALPRILATDFCTDEDGFRAALRGEAPVAVVLAYHPEFREILAHLAALAAGAGDVPVTIIGSALDRERGGPADPPGVLWHARAVDGSTGGILLGAQAAGARDVRGLPLDLEAFGGADLLARPLAASLFAETGTIGLLATRGSRAGLAPTALLARLEAPLPGAAADLLPGAALAPLEGLGRAPGRVEWWDRHAGQAVLARAAELAARGIPSTVRILPEGRDPEQTLGAVRSAGVDRVVFEADRLADLDPGPGTAAAVEDLEPWLEAAREQGLGTGVLFVVGLPGETRAAGAERTAILRRLSPDRLRCIPFEATGGTPMEELLRERDVLPAPELRWNRELHHPLRQACLDAEGFMANWSRALNLLAERESARSMAS